MFFSKRRKDDTLRFLKTDGTYTNFALRLVRNGHSFERQVLAQQGESHELHCTNTTREKKRTIDSMDLPSQPLQKRAQTESASFKPVNPAQSDERVEKRLDGKAPTVVDQPGHSRVQHPELTITREHVERERMKNEQLKSIKARKQEELSAS